MLLAESIAGLDPHLPQFPRVLVLRNGAGMNTSEAHYPSSKKRRKIRRKIRGKSGDVSVQGLKNSGRFRVAMSDRSRISTEWSMGINV